MKHCFLAFLLAYMCLATGCVSPVKGLFPTPPGQIPRTIYVLHRGLHTGVIVRASDIPDGVWPQSREFSGEYLEVGWGDSQGYRYPWSSGIALRATFASKGSVVLIHSFSGSITNEYAGTAKEIIAVQLSPAGFERLCAYIQDTYALGPFGHPIPKESVYPEQKFFLARGHYSAINTCNNWTAGALRAAGCPVRPRWSIFPGNVMRQTRRFGRVIWPGHKSQKAAKENSQPAAQPSAR